MDEMEEGKQKFLEVVKGIDPQVLVVIPVTPSNSMFLISLTKGANRKFITVPEDDIIDLPMTPASSRRSPRQSRMQWPRYEAVRAFTQVTIRRS